VFFAERMFWSRWRTDDDNVGAFRNLFVYSIAAEICLIAIRDFRSGHLADVPPRRTPWLAYRRRLHHDVFGADGIPFPLTIAWTGLSGMLSLLWWPDGMDCRPRCCFRLHGPLCSVPCSGCSGSWSIFWIVSRPPGSRRVYCALLHCNDRPDPGVRTLPVLHCVIFARRARNGSFWRHCPVLLHWRYVGPVQLIALVTLPPLFALIYLALRRNATDETRPDFLVAIDAPFPWIRALPIFLIPALASLIHEGCRIAGLTAPTNIVVFAITLPAVRRFRVQPVAGISAPSGAGIKRYR